MRCPASEKLEMTQIIEHRRLQRPKARHMVVWRRSSHMMQVTLMLLSEGKVLAAIAPSVAVKRSINIRAQRNQSIADLHHRDFAVEASLSPAANFGSASLLRRPASAVNNSVSITGLTL